MIAPIPRKSFKVLFLCTGNSARSIIAEAIMNKLGDGKFQAFSAGSHPRGEINPHTVQLLQGLGFNTEGFRSKSWDEFAEPGAPEFDFIFTVCDSAADETCPVWLGHPTTAHWGIPDPAAVTGTQAETAVAFKEAYRLLTQRISIFAALPFDKLDRLALQSKLKQIGQLEGATPKAKKRT